MNKLCSICNKIATKQCINCKNSYYCQGHTNEGISHHLECKNKKQFFKNNNFFSLNIEKETLENDFYRKVIYTDQNIQIVLMSLKRNEYIPEEIHETVTQFIRIESGKAMIRYKGSFEEYREDGGVFVISPNTKHYIENAIQKNCQLYTIYGHNGNPPHKPDTIHKTLKEALTSGE